MIYKMILLPLLRGLGRDKKKGMRAWYSKLGMWHLLKPEYDLNHASLPPILGITDIRPRKTLLGGEIPREVIAQQLTQLKSDKHVFRGASYFVIFLVWYSRLSSIVG